jgi:hypothetical protein
MDTLYSVTPFGIRPAPKKRNIVRIDPTQIKKEALNKTFIELGLEFNFLLDILGDDYRLNYIVTAILNKIIFQDKIPLNVLEVYNISLFLLSFFNYKLEYYLPNILERSLTITPFSESDQHRCSELKRLLTVYTRDFMFLYNKFVSQSIFKGAYGNSFIAFMKVNEFLEKGKPLENSLQTVLNIQKSPMPFLKTHKVDTFTKQLYTSYFYPQPTMLYSDENAIPFIGNHLIEQFEMRNLLQCFTFHLTPKLIDCIRCVFNNPNINGTLLSKSQADYKKLYFMGDSSINANLVFGDTHWNSIKTRRELFADNFIKLLENEQCYSPLSLKYKNKGVVKDLLPEIQTYFKNQVRLANTTASNHTSNCLFKIGPITQQQYTIQEYLKNTVLRKAIHTALEILIEQYLGDLMFQYSSIFFFRGTLSIDTSAENERLRNSLITYIFLDLLNTVNYLNRARLGGVSKDAVYSYETTNIFENSTAKTERVARMEKELKRAQGQSTPEETIKSLELQLQEAKQIRNAAQAKLNPIQFDSKSMILSIETIDTLVSGTLTPLKREELYETVKLALLLQLILKVNNYSTYIPVLEDIGKPKIESSNADSGGRRYRKTRKHRSKKHKRYSRKK